MGGVKKDVGEGGGACAHTVGARERVKEKLNAENGKLKRARNNARRSNGMRAGGGKIVYVILCLLVLRRL
jgi:hypothetical protein